MVFANNKQHIPAALLAIAASSTLLCLGSSLDPWWPLLWFAPLPVLLFALRNTWRSAALVAAASWLIGGLNLWHYLRVLGAPPTVWLGVFSTAALVFALAVLLFRALLLRRAAWSALLALPSAWVSFEYVRNLTTPHGTAGSFAYSQLNFLPFLQLASVTGPWGLSFLLMLFPAALAIGMHLRHSEPEQARRVRGTALSVIALVLIFGAVRLSVPSHEKVKVGLVASDLRMASDGPAAERLFREYGRQAEQVALHGPQIIVLPEKIGVATDSHIQEIDTIFQASADKTGATIVVGILRVSDRLQYNQARVYSPHTNLLSYDKHHLLPPFESELSPGKALTVWPSPPQTRGVAICKDMDFTPLSRQYGQTAVGLMLVPAWDFNLDRGWHGHIAVMRGVEDGFSVVRAAKNGYLTVSDNRGRILAETRSDSAPFSTLVAEVSAVHTTTLYLLLGDWFAWFAAATLSFVLARLYRLKRYSTERSETLLTGVA
jgi:apolipoprotein N-acyltransferase